MIELLITIAIAAIVAAYGIPNFTQTIRNSRLTTNINELVTSLNLARSEAIKRGISVTVRKSGAEWENGWNIFTDLDNDGVMDAGVDTLIRTYVALPNNYTLRGTTPSYTNRITYQNTGISANGSFVLCENSDGNNVPEAFTSRLVVVNNVGRVRMGADSDNDGTPEKQNGVEITSCTVSPFS